VRAAVDRSRSSTASRYQCLTHSVVEREFDRLRVGRPHSDSPVERIGTSGKNGAKTVCGACIFAAAFNERGVTPSDELRLPPKYR
jgi:hypothetical protein